jgi:hypothetical protein
LPGPMALRISGKVNGLTSSRTVCLGCARCRVIRTRTVMREIWKCRARAARAAVTAASATRQTTPARTTASVAWETMRVPTNPLGAGPASLAPWCRELP